MEHEQYDVESAESLVFDAFAADDGKLADGLRPFYIDYLLRARRLIRGRRSTSQHRPGPSNTALSFR